MKQHSPGDIKITLPTANQFPAIYYKRGISDKVYSSHSALLWDIVPVIKAEIQALVNEGVQYVQIDAPRYSYYIDPKWRSYIKNEMDLTLTQALDEAIRADNACPEGAKRAGVILAIHLCRGNNRSQWYAEGGGRYRGKVIWTASGGRVSA
jgi:5-methyltetrahydropteroyltriglutamate--homocysteine methyltransferase